MSQFASEVRRFGFPSLGVFCKHGIAGGLHCQWCGNVDRLPADEKLSGSLGVPT